MRPRRDDSDLPPETAGKCNARKRADGPPARCRMAAGHGTTHLGHGRCSRHGGSTQTGRAVAARELVADVARRFGAPREVDPLLALQEEVNRTAGLVDLIEAEVNATAGPDGRPLLVETISGRDGTTRTSPSPLLDIHHRERRHYIAAARAALDGGVVAERDRWVSEYQDRILGLLDDVITGLGHDPDSPEVVAVVSRCLGSFADAAAARELMAAPDGGGGVAW